MAVATGTGLLLGGALAAGGAVAGGLIGAKGAEEAAEKATNWQLKMYYQQREDLMPWMEAGRWALGEPGEEAGLIGMIGRGPGEFVAEEQPGYQFGYEEFVEKPTLRTAAATGRLGSGALQKELTRYAQQYATGILITGIGGCHACHLPGCCLAKSSH